MNDFKLPAYRLPMESMSAVKECVNLLVSETEGAFEPQKHPPHLTLLRQSLFGGRAGIDISTQYQALAEMIELESESYRLPVIGIENTTRSLSSAAVLAIVLDDPLCLYEAEYSSIRSRLPERIRGKSVTNTPHVTLGRLSPENLSDDLLARAKDKLPGEIDFGPLIFSAGVIKFHEAFKPEQKQ